MFVGSWFDLGGRLLPAAQWSRSAPFEWH